MIGLFVFGSLFMASLGYFMAGFPGLATGLIVAMAVNGSAAVVLGLPMAGIPSEGAGRGRAQLAGVLMLILVVSGAPYGGWEMGWSWAAVGHMMGSVALLIARRFNPRVSSVREASMTE